MTEEEARKVLAAYRWSKPLLVPAVVRVVSAGMSRAEVAELAGMTRPGIANMLKRDAERDGQPPTHGKGAVTMRGRRPRNRDTSEAGR